MSINSRPFVAVADAVVRDGTAFREERPAPGRERENLAALSSGPAIRAQRNQAGINRRYNDAVSAVKSDGFDGYVSPETLTRICDSAAADGRVTGEERRAISHAYRRIDPIWTEGSWAWQEPFVQNLRSKAASNPAYNDVVTALYAEPTKATVWSATVYAVADAAAADGVITSEEAESFNNAYSRLDPTVQYFLLNNLRTAGVTKPAYQQLVDSVRP